MKRTKADGPVRERWLWTVAAGLYLGLAAELVLLWLARPSWGRGALSGWVAETMTGREGGIAVYTAADLPSLLVFQFSFVQDLAAFFLVYPVFLHYVHTRHDKDTWLMGRLRRIEDAARRHESYVHRWGPLGVFLFMLVPFLVNGPLVGGVLGRMAGIPTRRLLLPVAASTAVAAAAWTLFYDQTVGRLGKIDPRLGYLVAGAVFVLLVGLAGAGYLADRRQAPRSDEEE